MYWMLMIKEIMDEPPSSIRRPKTHSAYQIWLPILKTRIKGRVQRRLIKSLCSGKISRIGYKW